MVTAISTTPTAGVNVVGYFGYGSATGWVYPPVGYYTFYIFVSIPNGGSQTQTYSITSYRPLSSNSFLEQFYGYYYVGGENSREADVKPFYNNNATHYYMSILSVTGYFYVYSQNYYATIMINGTAESYQYVEFYENEGGTIDYEILITSQDLSSNSTYILTVVNGAFLFLFYFYLFIYLLLFLFLNI